MPTICVNDDGGVLMTMMLNMVMVLLNIAKYCHKKTKMSKYALNK